MNRRQKMPLIHEGEEIQVISGYLEYIGEFVGETGSSNGPGTFLVMKASKMKKVYDESYTNLNGVIKIFHVGAAAPSGSPLIKRI